MQDGSSQLFLFFFLGRGGGGGGGCEDRSFGERGHQNKFHHPVRHCLTGDLTYYSLLPAREVNEISPIASPKVSPL